MINNREKGKLSLSLKKRENLGQTDTIITGREGIILSSRPSNNNQVVGGVFRELVHQILEKVNNEPFFKWPNKMMGNPEKRN